MRAQILRLIGWLSPSLRRQLRDYASRRSWRQLTTEIQPVLEQITSTSGWVVQAGPFQGMQYVHHARCSVLLPKLLGFYEREIADSVRELAARSPDAVVDVGCAEGYYAVGMSLIVSKTVVFAYDIDPESQRLCRALAMLNGKSDRVHVTGACDTTVLQSVIDRHSRVLVISDCEGYEEVLLDPTKAPGLARADLLIEVHEFARPGVTQLLIDRFRSSHCITRIPAEPIDADGIGALAAYDRTIRRKCASEFRPAGMEWFVCMPLN